MTAFFRFPHTPHLAWLGPGKPRDDKVLALHEARDLLAHELVVEEKVDGANLGFSVAHDGALRAQNRGNYLDIDDPSGQWKPLKRWLLTRRFALAEALAPDLMLFGEWCYAVHSVRYTRLPDWFLAFDVYDRGRAEFWAAARRNDFARSLKVEVVPQRAEGRVTIESLRRLIDSSALSNEPAEGVYVRRERDGRLVARAKLVSAEFGQAIEKHWSKRRLEVNRLAEEKGGARSGQ
jgi:hypothetical protein